MRQDLSRLGPRGIAYLKQNGVFKTLAHIKNLRNSRAGDGMLSVREFEKYQRDSGLSRKEAKILASIYNKKQQDKQQKKRDVLDADDRAAFKQLLKTIVEGDILCQN